MYGIDGSVVKSLTIKHGMKFKKITKRKTDKFMANWATKWWKQDKKKEKKSTASSYWYDDYSSDFNYSDFYTDVMGKDLATVKDMQKSLDLYKLSSTRRAVSNFVNIVTGKNIPVVFAGKNSFTDGRNVVISADIDEKFDVGVGLALHEGSHIVLSDFNLLKAVSDFKGLVLNSALKSRTLDEIDTAIESSLDSKEYKQYKDVLYHIFSPKNGLLRHDTSFTYNSIEAIVSAVMCINNWIEDRRIDQYIYRNSPGYRQYYTTMYDHYFNDKTVTKGIDSDEYTDETIDSYIFRIINFVNEKTNLDKLKGLRRIYNAIDLRNISRLNSSSDSLNLSIEIVEEIYKNVGSQLFDKPVDGQQPGQGSGDSNSVEITDIEEGESDDMGGTPGNPTGSGTGQLSSQSTKSASDADGSGDSKTSVTLSKTAQEKLKKLFEKQKAFLKDGAKLKKLNAKDEKSISQIDESGSELVRVGTDYKERGGYVTKGVDCIVIKRVTKEMFSSDTFPFTCGSDSPSHTQQVLDGLALGKLLGNKLSIRSESRDTVYNRLNTGKIDRRLISGLGYGSESVFFNKEVDQYKKVNLHISLDYSGSMSGNRLEKTIVATTAIVKAATMARNINVQVSIRSTDRGTGCRPVIALIYDSRRDGLKHYCYMMERLVTANTTPEGLCFEAIMKNFVPSTKDVDSYFLNFSDGEPGYAGQGFSYQGEPAAIHTANQIKRMKENGMNVLSYFINESSGASYSWNIFKKCYGDGAKQINTSNMNEVARTMNELFLKKNNRS